MPDDFRALIHTPADVAVEFIKYAERLNLSGGVQWGVPVMDRVIIPAHPGDVIGIIARPGHGKSTLMAYLSRFTANRLAEDVDNKRVVAYATFEQSTEEIETMFEIDPGGPTITDIAWGRADIEELRARSIKRPSLPIVLIGGSIERRKHIPRMTIENVYHAIRSLETDYSMKPYLICLDYIQIIPVNRAEDRINQVGEAIIQAKELAIQIGCPIVIGVQARRELDQRKSKIPTSSDCQWASAIEQVCDKLIGIWRPVLTEESKVLEVGDKQIPITQNLLVAQLLKQRMAPAGQKFLLHFAPEYVRLAELELERANYDYSDN